MASQRVSELLNSFGCNERIRFFKQWYQHVRENEFVALDITSLSSYSENMGMLGWGHNRDGEKLPQLNICMLFGEKTVRPIFQTLYNGSLTDVTTLETTLSEFEVITGTRDIMLIMDKGFSSAKNINQMLGDVSQTPFKFLILAPYTTNFAKDLVKNEHATIDTVDNVIFTHDASMPVRGVYRPCIWNKNIHLHAHIYFDPQRALAERNDVFSYIATLKSMALKDYKNPAYQKEFQ